MGLEREEPGKNRDKDKSGEGEEEERKELVEKEIEEAVAGKIDEMLERIIEEKIENLIERRLGRRIERNIEEYMIAPEGKRILIRRFTHPIPIRNLNRNLYMRMRKLAAKKGVPVGQLINEAMKYYLENHDQIALKKRKLQILRRLRSIGVPGAMQQDVRDILKKELEEELNRINKRLKELETP